MSAEVSAYSLPKTEPLLVVVSGPSGVGKDAVLSSLRGRSEGRPWHFAVTATTRPRRSNEKDGVDYIFIDPEQFQQMVPQGEFLEHAMVYGNWYGVPKKQAREAMAQGKDVILKVDVQGAATIKELAPQGVFIFLVPPSIEELRKRLTLRATESSHSLGVRLETAQNELEQASSFDYKVVNRDGGLDEAVTLIEAIILSEKCRVQPCRVSI